MKFKDENMLLKLRFLSGHRDDIIKEYLDHKPKTGYVFVKVSSDFQILEPPRFIERSFNKAEFSILFEEQREYETDDNEDNWMYYEVHWQLDNTTNHVKEHL